MIGAYIFLALLALLFLAVAVISLPSGQTVNLGHTGASGLVEKKQVWYTLEEGSYTIGPNLGSISVGSSILPLVSTQYTYYLVTVTPDAGESFSMAVRVTGKKYSSLEQGQTVALYGMASGLTDERIGQAVPTAPLQYRCLNDNGDTVFKRGVQTVVFAVAAALCIALIVLMKIALRK